MIGTVNSAGSTLRGLKNGDRRFGFGGTDSLLPGVILYLINSGGIALQLLMFPPC